MFFFGVFVGISIVFLTTFLLFLFIFTDNPLLAKLAKRIDDSYHLSVLGKSLAVAYSVKSTDAKLVSQLPCLIITKPPMKHFHNVPILLSLINKDFTISVLRPSIDGAREHLLAQFVSDMFWVKIDFYDKYVLHLLPKEGSKFIGSQETGELSSLGKVSMWESAVLIFTTSREAARWFFALSPGLETAAWLHFTRRLEGLGTLTAINAILGRFYVFNTAEETALKLFLSTRIAKKLEDVQLPPPLLPTSRLHLFSLDVGREPPLLANPTFLGLSSVGELRYEIDLSYTGGFTIVLNSTLEIRRVNLPDIRITVKIKRVIGRLHLAFDPPPAMKMWIGFAHPPQLQLQVKQHATGGGGNALIRALLRALPDLSDFVNRLVRRAITSGLVFPSLEGVQMPNFYKSRRARMQAMTGELSDPLVTQLRAMTAALAKEK